MFPDAIDRRREGRSGAELIAARRGGVEARGPKRKNQEEGSLRDAGRGRVTPKGMGCTTKRENQSLKKAGKYGGQYWKKVADGEGPRDEGQNVEKTLQGEGYYKRNREIINKDKGQGRRHETRVKGVEARKISM